MTKICVYAICKNESKFINRWLASMSEADYIVVLDTGSTDGTYEKLMSDHRIKKVKQKIYDTFRFDVARNDSLKLVPKDADVLVCTDIDEVFEPGWADILRQNWICGTHNRAHYQYAWSHLDDGAPTDVFINDKIHTKDYFWKYPVHEVLCSNFSESEENVLNLDGVLLHHYPDLTRSDTRYFNLIQIRAEENPTDCYSRYLLAREYGLAQDYETAIKEFEYTLSLPNIKNESYLCYIGSLILRADLLAAVGRLDDAVYAYEHILLEDKTYREPYLKLANIYLNSGFYDVAIGYVYSGLRNSTQKYNWVEQSPTWTYLADDTLSLAYFNIGEYEKAVQHCQRALQYVPNDERIRNNLNLFLSTYQEQLNNN